MQTYHNQQEEILSSTSSSAINNSSSANNNNNNNNSGSRVSHYYHHRYNSYPSSNNNNYNSSSNGSSGSGGSTIKLPSTFLEQCYSKNPSLMLTTPPKQSSTSAARNSNNGEKNRVSSPTSSLGTTATSRTAVSTTTSSSTTSSSTTPSSTTSSTPSSSSSSSSLYSNWNTCESLSGISLYQVFVDSAGNVGQQQQQQQQRQQQQQKLQHHQQQHQRQHIEEDRVNDNAVVGQPHLCQYRQQEGVEEGRGDHSSSMERDESDYERQWHQQEQQQQQEQHQQQEQQQQQQLYSDNNDDTNNITDNYNDDDDKEDPNRNNGNNFIYNLIQRLLPSSSSNTSNNNNNNDENKNKYHKKLGALLISIISIYIYSRLRHHHRRIHYKNSKSKNRSQSSSSLLLLSKGYYYYHYYRYQNKLENTIRYLLQLFMIPIGRVVSCLSRQLLRLGQYRLKHQQQGGLLLQQQPPPTVATAVTIPWEKNNITTTTMSTMSTTPLSYLLSLAKSGNIIKVMIRDSMVCYLHSLPSSSQSSSSSSSLSSLSNSTTTSTQSNLKKQPQQQQQQWSKTILPSSNPSIINDIISTLLKHGCYDITTIPESIATKVWNVLPMIVLPFGYLGALYWIMKRLHRLQLEGDDDDENNVGSSSSSGGITRTNTTFTDVAGINSSLEELSTIVSYLRQPNVYNAIGASPPRGVLLHGPPGCGKTLLARAIAGEVANSRTNNTSRLGGVVVGGRGHDINTIDAFAVCSGSDFVDTYVGRGAARVRLLFRKVRRDAVKNYQYRQRLKKKKKKMRSSLRRQYTTSTTSFDDENGKGVLSRAFSDVSERIVGAWEGLQLSKFVMSNEEEDDDVMRDKPLAIIFIDEIDALAKKRDTGFSSSSLGGNDEREQTLNQLLTEMDGFKTGDDDGSKAATTSAIDDNVTVIVIAATNRPHVLDPAILRSGRFDRRVAVHLPDCQGREDILRLHARHIRYDESSVNLSTIAKMTPNFSGADLKTLINEAALLAVRNGSTLVLQDHLVEAAQKIK